MAERRYIQNVICVNVLARFSRAGVLSPYAICWDIPGGQELYRIDSYTCDNPAKATVSNPIRYLVKIRGQERYLLYEPTGQWFLEDTKTRPVTGRW